MKVKEIFGDSVSIKLGDSIPQYLLDQANQHEQISGYVFPNEDKFRVGIYYKNEVVGFFTPRQEKNKWRIGAIFVLPEYSGKNIASKAIIEFLKGKQAAPVFIDVNNIASQKTFQKAGYKKQPEMKQWSDNSGHYNVWSK